jgi:hypothetical protein
MLIPYNFDKEYVPRQESLMFFNWNNLMFDNSPNETPRMHFQLMDILLSKDEKIVSKIARGHAKTTLLSQKVPLFVATFGTFPNFGNMKNIVIIEATFGQADEQLKNIEYHYNGSPKLQSFMDLKRVEGRVTIKNKKGHTTYISALGVGQSFRGMNIDNQRIQLLILDDGQIDASIYSNEANDKLKSWWIGSAMQSVDYANFRVRVIGTPMSDNDLINSLCKSSQYTAFTCPIAKEFNLDPKKIIPAWADKFTPEKIIDAYNDAKEIGQEGDFFREMFLEVRNKETQIFSDEHFKNYKYSDFKKNLHRYSFFTSMDLAVSKKQHADRSVIITIAVDSSNNWFIVDIFAGRVSPSEVIDELFKQVRKFKPIEVRAEKAGIQQVFNHFVDIKMQKENTYFRLEPLVKNSVQQKELRILGIQPKFRMRQIFFPEDTLHEEIMLLKNELLGQTREMNTTGHDDMIDCLANFNDDNFVMPPIDYGEANPKEYEGYYQKSANNFSVF